MQDLLGAGNRAVFLFDHIVHLARMLRQVQFAGKI